MTDNRAAIYLGRTSDGRTQPRVAIGGLASFVAERLEEAKPNIV